MTGPENRYKQVGMLRHSGFFSFERGHNYLINCLELAIDKGECQWYLIGIKDVSTLKG